MAKRLKLVFSAFVSLLLLIYLVKVLFNFSGALFYLELFGTFVLTLLIVFALVFYRESSGAKLLFFTGLASLVNFFLLWLVVRKDLPLLLFLSLALLLFNLPPGRPQRKEELALAAGMSQAQSAPDHSVVLEAPRSVAKAEKKSSAKRFVASKRGKYYHKAGSDWAVSIKEANQIWFATKSEAEAKGYKEYSEKA